MEHPIRDERQVVDPPGRAEHLHRVQVRFIFDVGHHPDVLRQWRVQGEPSARVLILIRTGRKGLFVNLRGKKVDRSSVATQSLGKDFHGGGGGVMPVIADTDSVGICGTLVRVGGSP